MTLNLRAIEVFKPYSNEFPEQLLIDAGSSDSQIERWQAAPIVRITKLDEEIMGVYAMARDEVPGVNGLRFELYGLVTAPNVRRQGLGRWLLGHAIGVAESKGGRHLWIDQTGGSRLFSRVGFVPVQADGVAKTASGMLQFDMIPE